MPASPIQLPKFDFGGVVPLVGVVGATLFGLVLSSLEEWWCGPFPGHRTGSGGG